MPIVIDEAWAQVPPATAKANGVVAVSMYTGQDTSGKNMTLGRVQGYAGVGIKVITNFEFGATQATFGFNQGVNDARLGWSQASECGMPSWAPILFSVDAAVPVSSVEPYFSGAASVLGSHRVGVYGDYTIVHGLVSAGLARYAWQTQAWSNGQADLAQIQLLQLLSTLDGADIDEITGDITPIAWFPGQAAPVPPTLTFTEVPVNVAEMNLPTLAIGTPPSNYVQLMQSTLNVHGGTMNTACDGVFGSATQARLQSYQTNNGLTVDGICGPKTWASLLS